MSAEIAENRLLFHRRAAPYVARWVRGCIGGGESMRIRRKCPVAVLSLGLVWIAAAHLQAQAAAQGGKYSGPRTADGKPDLNGIWQVLNSAHWNLEPHSPEEGVPGGQGVVEGGTIPYQPAALAQAQTRTTKRGATDDPVSKCYLPGVPRITYVPLPFEIVQTPKYVVMAYEFAHARRIIYTDGSPHVEALEFWMGDSRGKWEGDTLVVSTQQLQRQDVVRQGRQLPQRRPARRRAVHADGTADHIQYEVTIEDPRSSRARGR